MSDSRNSERMREPSGFQIRVIGPRFDRILHNLRFILLEITISIRRATKPVGLVGAQFGHMTSGEAMSWLSTIPFVCESVQLLDHWRVIGKIAIHPAKIIKFSRINASK